MMSHDRIQFTLAPRYYLRHRNPVRSNGMAREDCAAVLRQAFGLSVAEALELFEQHPEGVVIRCRPSQFGRFIVYRKERLDRYQRGCINGVKDLSPCILSAEDNQARWAAACVHIGVSTREAELVADVFHASMDDFADHVLGARQMPHVDVSRNRHVVRDEEGEAVA